MHWFCLLNIQRSHSSDLGACFVAEYVRVALLLPMTGAFPSGLRTAGAAALAVNQVNADKSLLLRRRLRYDWADSGCSAQQGLMAMGELLRGASVDAVIGRHAALRAR